MHAMRSPLASLILASIPLMAAHGCGESTKARPADAAADPDLPTGADVTAGTGGAGGTAGVSGSGGRGTGGGAGAGSGGVGTAGTAGQGSGGSGRGGAGGSSAGGADAAVDAPASSGGAGGGGSGGTRTDAGGRGGSGGAGTGGSGGAGGPLCPGVEAPPAEFSLCRTLSDCPEGNNYCMASGPTAADGCAGQLAYVMPPPPTECQSNGDCGPGKVCMPNEWCWGYGNSTVCAAGCLGKPCPAGYRCDTTTGSCMTLPCGSDYTCPNGRACTPGASGQDDHGCVPVLCTAGYTCPGASTCQPGAANTDRNGCLGTLCTAGYSCPTGTTCFWYAYDADSHGCVVATCAGFACPVNQICQVDGSRGAYCTRKACKTDADCDCGACLGAEGSSSGQCFSRLGICAHWSAGGASGSLGGAQGGGGTGGGGAGGAVDADAIDGG
jgi:hypothetical protein